MNCQHFEIITREQMPDGTEHEIGRCRYCHRAKDYTLLQDNPLTKQGRTFKRPKSLLGRYANMNRIMNDRTGANRKVDTDVRLKRRREKAI